MTHYRFLEPSFPDLTVFARFMQEVLESKRLSNAGPKVKELEASFCTLFEINQVICVSSASLGLLVLLRALEVPKNKEVLLPAYNFPAPAEAVLWNGLRLSYAEVHPDDLTLDPLDAARRCSSQIKVIMPVHSLGNLADVDAFRSLAEKRGLLLIFDGASALGTLISSGRKTTGIGLATVVSLHATKILPAGEGGAILTNDRSLADVCRRLVNFGFDSEGSVCRYGLNAKMSELQAAFALAGLKNLRGNMKLRLELAEAYRKGLSRIPWLSPCAAKESIMHLFPVMLSPSYPAHTREALRQQWEALGIETRSYYNLPLHLMPAFRPSRPISLPITEDVCSRVICLPFHTQLSFESIEDIINKIEAAEITDA